MGVDAVGLRFGGGGSGAGLASGDAARKAVGDGIVIASILTAFCRETSTRHAEGSC